ncbi:hypothetical protein LCGC14_1578140 [marine sediment metagenome]|uniref:Uncharacterized protein n=1 Tax=marine sediment metagenome TaxID=412755 RepID=A0A0F9J3R5_9ZZZZ
MKYIKKPIVIEAIQFNGFPEDIDPTDFRFSGAIQHVLEQCFENPPDWLVEAFSDKSLSFFHSTDGWTVTMTSSDGNEVSALATQWVIKEPVGVGFYPCDDKTFQHIYDLYTEAD